MVVRQLDRGARHGPKVPLILDARLPRHPNSLSEGVLDRSSASKRLRNAGA